MRPGSTITLAPSFMRAVRAAMNVIATMGSRVGALTRSVTQSESNPRRSDASTKFARSTPPAGTPSPIRIFMPATYRAEFGASAVGPCR